MMTKSASKILTGLVLAQATLCLAGLLSVALRDQPVRAEMASSAPATDGTVPL
jgi:hypothetical protein